MLSIPAPHLEVEGSHTIKPAQHTTCKRNGGGFFKINVETLPIHNHILGRAANIPICICF
jgi:hypothetical protein